MVTKLLHGTIFKGIRREAVALPSAAVTCFWRSFTIAVSKTVIVKQRPGT